MNSVTYLGPDLVDGMRAREIANLVWIANSDIKGRLSGLLNTKTRLCGPLGTIVASQWNGTRLDKTSTTDFLLLLLLLLLLIA